ncbi:MAG: extracellular solute-binding protein [Lachnospiraceae bacterium]|nr:extracellular solute-binding protein [Lachnospiraceae bacterium]
MDVYIFIGIDDPGYGRDQYKSSIDHAEDLADPALGLDLDCIRSNIILNTDDGTLPMVPVFSNTYGMLVNSSLFEKEGLSVPTTYKELVSVCDEFRKKGYKNPMTVPFSSTCRTCSFLSTKTVRTLRWPTNFCVF